MMLSRSSIAGLCCILLLGFGSPTHASPYQVSRGREITCLGTGGLLHLAGALTAGTKPPPALSDIEKLDKDDIPRLDRPYAGRWDPGVEKLSDVYLASCLVLPVSLILANRNDVKTLGLMYAETLLLASGGANLSKGAVERYRPFAYGDEAPLRLKLEKDARRSFFSGHAAGIASSLVFTASVYSDYYPRSRYRPYVWGGAVVGAIAGSWLRVEAGQHFPSDAVAGMLWGGLVGYSIPALHHRNQTRVSVIPFVHEGERGVIMVGRF